MNPTAEQMKAIIKKLPKPRVSQPAAVNRGKFYCRGRLLTGVYMCKGSGYVSYGGTIREAYARWVAQVWRVTVIAAQNSRSRRMS